MYRHKGLNTLYYLKPESQNVFLLDFKQQSFVKEKIQSETRLPAGFSSCQTEDGCIYIYDKGDKQTNGEDYTKETIATDASYRNKEGKNQALKADVVKKMQSLVEDYDFEAPYAPTEESKERVR